MKSIAHLDPSKGKYAAINIDRLTLDLPRRGGFWRDWGAFLGVAALCAVLIAIVAFGTGR